MWVLCSCGTLNLKQKVQLLISLWILICSVLSVLPGVRGKERIHTSTWRYYGILMLHISNSFLAFSWVRPFRCFLWFWTKDLQLECNWPMLRITVNYLTSFAWWEDSCKDSLNYCFQVFKVFHGGRAFGLPCIRRKESLALYKGKIISGPSPSLDYIFM